MNCPECNQPFSIVTDTMHGERVRRLRRCAVCKAEWQTIEITATEQQKLWAAAEESRRQVAQLWKENGS